MVEIEIMKGRIKDNSGSTNCGNQGGYQRQIPLTCSTCERCYSGACHNDIDACWTCGQSGHLMRNCPKSRSNPLSGANVVPVNRNAGP